jgi:SAM-dependent methyltransferase
MALWARRRRGRDCAAETAAAAPAIEEPAPLIHPDDHERLRRFVAPVNDQSQPNINYLLMRLNGLDALALNVKAMGYQLARQLSASLAAQPSSGPQQAGLDSKLSTQADLESAWARHWLSELKITPFLHRKLWEFAYILQVLHDRGLLRRGVRGVGFGCGREPLASYFATRAMDVVTSDLPPEDARAAGWMSTNEYAPAPDHARDPQIVDAETFARHVRHRAVDMNAIPGDLRDFDFCWSTCALEHLGSIEQGLQFIERSLDCLRPGGTAVHTTEFNINPNGPTVDNWVTVYFQRKHMERLAARLAAHGHVVAPFDFSTGDGPLDQFIDLPPWPNDVLLGEIAAGLGMPYHLKVAADGFIVTCLGLAITKAA